MRVILIAHLLPGILSVSLLAGPTIAFTSRQDSAAFVPLRPEDTTLHVAKIEEIGFLSRDFHVVGNRYLPDRGDAQVPLILWVSGSGPSFLTVKNKQSIRLVNCFLDGGFAYFRIDKPGLGDSKGGVNDDSVFAQLSDIIVDALRRLKSNPAIDARHIGLFGSSQAGYIIPLAISKCSDIAFMIGSTCPGENSIDQWDYLLEKQMICEGARPDRAARNASMFRRLRTTRDKKEFDAARDYFEKNPLLVQSVGYDSSFSKRARSWWPRTTNSTDEMHFDPMTVVEKINIPLFLVYGGHDTQINPRQAIEAYKIAAAKAGNTNLRVVVLADGDHNMSPGNGCLQEIDMLNKSNNYVLDPAYLETIRGWIRDLKLGVKVR